MEIDIEALVAEWKQQQEKIILTIDERKERLLKRNRENGELYEQVFRRKVSLIAKCVSGYAPSRLHDWFLLDHWTVKEGLILLCGFEPKHIPHDEEGQLHIPAEHNYVQNLHIEKIQRLDNLPVYDPLTAKILGKSRVQNINWEFREALI